MGNGVLGGPPPRKFRNMKCSRSDSRPILGIGFVNGGFENFMYLQLIFLKKSKLKLFCIFCNTNTKVPLIINKK